MQYDLPGWVMKLNILINAVIFFMKYAGLSNPVR